MRDTRRPMPGLLSFNANITGADPISPSAAALGKLSCGEEKSKKNSRMPLFRSPQCNGIDLQEKVKHDRARLPIGLGS